MWKISSFSSFIACSRSISWRQEYDSPSTSAPFCWRQQNGSSPAHYRVQKYALCAWKTEVLWSSLASLLVRYLTRTLPLPTQNLTEYTEGDIWQQYSAGMLASGQRNTAIYTQKSWVLLSFTSSSVLARISCQEIPAGLFFRVSDLSRYYTPHCAWKSVICRSPHRSLRMGQNCDTLGEDVKSWSGNSSLM